MIQADVLVNLLTRAKHMVNRHLADFSDADLLVRPVPNANHAAWQLAHLVYYGHLTVKALDPTSTFALPEHFDQTQGAEAAASDDPKRFPSKAELIRLYEACADATIAAVKGGIDLGAASPDMFKNFAPTLGELVLMGPLHTGMHMGQIQVIRRALKKPVLF